MLTRAQSLLRCRDAILSALLTEAKHRSEHVDWERREREAVALAANQYATNHARKLVTVDEVEHVEPLAMGHVDYASKLALYVAEMVHGLRGEFG